MSRVSTPRRRPLARPAMLTLSSLLLLLSSLGDLGALAVSPPAPGVTRWKLAVTETAGLRRFGYPVRVVVPRDLRGLLRQVRAGKTDYLRPGSPGLLIRSRDQVDSRVGGMATVGRVTRTGPLATALRFEGTATLGGGRQVASVVEMEFPSSKSWVQVTWTVADPAGQVAGLGAELNLNT